MSRKKAMVTGGAGFIGSHLVDRLLELEYDVLVVDNLSTGRMRNVPKAAHFFLVDINDSELEKVFQAEKPDIVFHQAAQMEVRFSVENPVFDAENNIIGSIRVLEHAKNAGVKKVVFASSGGAIYGEQDTFPACEDHPQRPLSPYGVCKATVEKYLYYYYKTFGMQYVALRYGNVFGPRQNSKGEAGVIAIFIDKMLMNEQPVINGTGEQTRDYVFVDDVVDANIKAIESVGSDAFNIGTALETDVNKIFRALRRELNLEDKVEEVHGEAKKGEQFRSVIDINKAREILGWEPQTTFEKGIEKTVKWFVENFDDLKTDNKIPEDIF